jgi:translocation protein SEC62
MFHLLYTSSPEYNFQFLKRSIDVQLFTIYRTSSLLKHYPLAAHYFIHLQFIMAQQGPPQGGMPPFGMPPGGQPPPGQMPVPRGPDGQPLTPQQMQAMQQQFMAEAARQGLTPQQFAEKLRAHAMAQRQAQMQGQGGQMQQGPGGQMPSGGQMPQGGPQGGPQQQQQQQMQQNGTATGQQVPIQPGPPRPEAIELAKFLRNQDLKSRPCIFQEKRKDLFKGMPKEAHCIVDQFD